MKNNSKCPETDDKEVLVQYLLERIEYLIYLQKKKSKSVSSALPSKSDNLHS